MISSSDITPWLLLLLACCQPLPLPADEPSQLKSSQRETWRRSREIAFPAAADPSLVRIPLDADFWTHTRPGYPDAAVADDRHRLIPFLIRHSPGSEVSTQKFMWTPADVELRHEPDDSLSIFVRLQHDDPQPEFLQVQTPLRNFEQKIEVTDESTDPPTHLCQPALFFDYSQFMDVRRTEIALRQSDTRLLKIRIAAATDDLESPFRELTRTQNSNGQTEQSEKSLRVRRAFRIDRILLGSSKTITVSSLSESRALQLVSCKEEPKYRHTVAEFTGDLCPVTSLTLQTSTRNFSRSVTVQVPADNPKDGWRDIATGTLSDFSAGSLTERHLVLPAPEFQAKRLRLLIQNLDSFPLEITGLTATGPLYELLLLAEPGQRYHLLYDNEIVTRPQHDLQALNRALQISTAAVTAELLPVKERRTQFKSVESRQTPVQFNSPWLLGTLVAISAALLAASLYRAVTRVESVFPDHVATEPVSPDSDTTRQSP